MKPISKLFDKYVKENRNFKQQNDTESSILTSASVLTAG